MKKNIILVLLLLLFIPFIVKAEDVTFRPVDNFYEIQQDSHYIITIYNTVDNNWYALGVDESGNSTSIKIDDPTHGLKIDKKDIKTNKYIFTCSKKNDNYVIKLRSNSTNEESGKKYSFYLKEGEMFNLGGGDIYVGKNHDSTTGKNYFSFARKKGKSLYYDVTNNQFIDNYVDYNTIGYFYILTDNEKIDFNSGSATLYKLKTAKEFFDVLGNMEIGDKLQFVYTTPNGDKYILTSEGAKKVTISNDKFTTNDYLVALDYRNKTNFHGIDAGFIGTVRYSMMYNPKLVLAHKDKVLNLQNGKIFDDDYYYVRNLSMSFGGLTYGGYGSYYTHEGSIIAITDEEYSNVAFNVGVLYKFVENPYSSTSNTMLWWDDSINDFVMQIENYDTTFAAYFEVYYEKKPSDLTTVEYYSYGNNEVITSSTTTEIFFDELENSRKPWVDENGNIQYDESYRFLGYTDDPTKSGIVKDADNENIMDYNVNSKKVELTNSFKNKYSIINKLSDARKTNGVVKLYQVVANENIKENAYLGKSNKKNIIGVIDWKNTQEGKPEEELAKYDINQGSINIEVYKDGKIWLPKGKVYYKYHNDNAADLNIKFLNDDITNLDEYLTSRDDFQESPDKLVIVGVYAEQGGSEEGLYLPFNWISENGGQIDNVKGGSTVKIYLTTKYTSKYYLNNELYKIDEYIYTPTATKNILSKNSKNSNYLVNVNNNNELLNKTTEIGYFKEDSLKRGRYSSFSYELLKEKDTMNVLKLPDQKLVYDYWLVKDEGGKVLGIALENQIIKIASKNDVNYLYMGNDDNIDTVHLYAYTPDFSDIPIVPKDTPIISIPKETKSITQLLKNPETAGGILLLTIFFMVSCGLLIYFNNKKGKTKKYNS